MSFGAVGRDRSQLLFDLVDVASKDRRQVGVDHGRVAPRNEFHQRTDLVAYRYLLKAELASYFRNTLLVLVVPIAVHQHDRYRAHATLQNGGKLRLDESLVQRYEHLAIRAHALVHLNDGLVQHLGQLDVEREKVRTVLIADPQCIAKAACGDEDRRFALAFEQGIRRHGRSHLDGVDGGPCVTVSEQHPNPLDGGVAISARVLRQELVRNHRTLRVQCDNVGERAAPVDPELPPRRIRTHRHALPLVKVNILVNGKGRPVG